MKTKWLLMTLVLNTALQAQVVRDFSGRWEGVLDVGVQLRIVMNISADTNGVIRTTLDSPDQSAFGIPTDTTIIDGESITVEMSALGARFTGKAKEDSLIEGKFIQGAELTLVLKKTKHASPELKRPQTPQGPFSYKSEELSFKDTNTGLTYGATFTMPRGKGPFPTAVMISGSGPQDRDASVFGHKIFAVIADHLARIGIAVLRVDDRGVGKTSGNFASSTSLDFAADTHAALDYLKTRPEVNKKKLGLIGHSEGGMIAPMVANERKDIDFIVLMAAPGVRITQLMSEQNAAVLLASGTSPQAVKAYIPLYDELVQLSLREKDSALLKKSILDHIDTWASATDSQYVKEIGLDRAVKRQSAANSFTEALSEPWFRFFLAYDPVPALRQLKTKVLALNGGRDIQVLPTSNINGIEEALKKSSSKFETAVLPGLNHLFQTCDKCSVSEYQRLEETIAPIALNAISGWLEKNVKE